MFATQDNTPPQNPGNGDIKDAALIFDANTENFDQAVMQASMEVPVLVDFWAPWCAPCKQLGPLLEAAVQNAGGAVKLAKVDIDQNQQLAAALQVQSVPTVFAIFQGQPIDAFTGAKPPNEIQAFIDKIVQTAKSAAPDALDIPAALQTATEALTNGDLATAHGLYTQILTQDQKNAPAYSGIIRVFIAADKQEDAQQLVDNAPDLIKKDAAFMAAKTALELMTDPPAEEDIRALESRIFADSNDHLARFELAKALFANGQKEEALGALLEIIDRDPEWKEEKARKELLKFFDAIGPADPLTIAARRKLSSILFS